MGTGIFCRFSLGTVFSELDQNGNFTSTTPKLLDTQNGFRRNKSRQFLALRQTYFRIMESSD